MNAGGWIGTVIGAIVALGVAYITARGAGRTAEVNVAAKALEQVVPIWQATIDQLQVTQNQQATQLKEQSAQIAELQQKDRTNVAWKQVALNHLISLHTYIRVHLHRDDIPTVPPELAADIPPFTQAPPVPGGTP